MSCKAIGHKVKTQDTTREMQRLKKKKKRKRSFPWEYTNIRRVAQRSWAPSLVVRFKQNFEILRTYILILQEYRMAL